VKSESKFSYPSQPAKSSAPRHQPQNSSAPRHQPQNSSAPRHEVKQEASNECPVYAIDYARLETVTSKFSEVNRVCVAAFNEMWKDEIESGMFKDGLYNVYGNSPKGSNERRYPLDSHRVLLLQNFVQDKMPAGSDKDRLWSKCVSAIHKRIYSMKDANKENEVRPGRQSKNNSYGSNGSSSNGGFDPFDDEKAYVYC
jgi:hypothetical protein